jgi:amidase
VAHGINLRFLRGVADDARAMPQSNRLQRRTRGFARLGGLVSDAGLRWAVREGERLATRVEDMFREFDVLMTPVSTGPQVAAGQWEGLPAIPTALLMNRAFPFQVAWNMTGQPAASVPMGSTDDGMPVGVQFVGRPDDEPTLVSLAAQLEAELRWPDRRPTVT